MFPLPSVEDKSSGLESCWQECGRIPRFAAAVRSVPCSESNCGLNSPCCRGASCRRRAIPAARGWRSLRRWRVSRRRRRAPAVGTPSAARRPAAWGQRPETWGVCCLKGHGRHKLSETLLPGQESQRYRWCWLVKACPTTFKTL